MLICVATVAGMVGMSFAAVPLYNLFCRVTGYGGTTQKAAQASDIVIDRTVRVRFDASVNPSLNWQFHPKQREITLKVGESAIAFYEARNLSGKITTGTATFNVTPLKAGLYFTKIDCFCFTEQTLQPGKMAEMPVTFYVDPEIAKDPNLDDVKTITLSYTFFASENDGAGKKTAAVKGTRRSGIN